jgi:cation diffusion facilitator CzcD-associated flavoprotein CzcO
MERFAGQVVHPQNWPEGLEYVGKQVVVIGSGATAVTLVPVLAERAAHVTMLQRSPTYIVARPSEDRIARRLRRFLPRRLAYGLTRWKNVLVGAAFFRLARRRPDFTRRLLLRGVTKELGPDYDVEAHFTPRYNPWDQRLCVAPDADLFTAIRSGRASVATDEIESFDENGIRLRSGGRLDADIVVSATGLVLKLAGGVRVVVDGHEVDPSQATAYKGAMLSDVPNLAMAFGYTNASWTLRCDLTAEYVCRLLNYMDRHGYVRCTPRRRDSSPADRPLLDFNSGYVRRALDALPRQGGRRPWRLGQNYLRDLIEMRFGGLEDGAMEFARQGEAAGSKETT